MSLSNFKCIALISIFLLGLTAQATILTRSNKETALESTKTYVAMGRKILSAKIPEGLSIDAERFGAYCALSTVIADVRDVAFLSFRHLYSDPVIKIPGVSEEELNRAKSELRLRLESALINNFSSLFSEKFAPSLQRVFAWEEARVRYRKYDREGTQVPGYIVTVTMYKEVESKTGTELKNPLDLEFTLAQSREDIDALTLADLKVDSFKVSFYFASARKEIESAIKKIDGYEEVFRLWSAQYKPCPDDFTPYYKYFQD